MLELYYISLGQVELLEDEEEIRRHAINRLFQLIVDELKGPLILSFAK